MDAQGYFDMQAKAAGDRAAHALIGRHPEPQLVAKRLILENSTLTNR